MSYFIRVLCTVESEVHSTKDWRRLWKFRDWALARSAVSGWFASAECCDKESNMDQALMIGVWHAESGMMLLQREIDIDTWSTLIGPVFEVIASLIDPQTSQN